MYIHIHTGASYTVCYSVPLPIKTTAYINVPPVANACRCESKIVTFEIGGKKVRRKSRQDWLSRSWISQKKNRKNKYTDTHTSTLSPISNPPD